MRKTLYRYLVLFLTAGAIIAFDQWTKAIVRNNLAVGESWMPWAWLAPHARFVHWFNEGVAFGMFQGMSWLFAIVAVLISAAIIYYYPRVPDEDWLLRLAMSLQMAGAIGNLIDRLTNNWQVTDFISVGRFPVFNVADISISIGVAVLVLGVWLQERRHKQEAREQAQREAEQVQDSGERPPFDRLPS